MALRRIDNRSRFRDRYLNERINQVQQMNKTRFYFYGQEGGNIKLAGSITYDAVYETEDHNLYCPPIGPIGWAEVPQHFYLDRMALPTWGTTHDATVGAQAFAESIAANAALGYYDDDLENNGWGGYDLTGVSASDYLTSGGYDPPGQTNNSCGDPPSDHIRGHGSDKSNDGARANIYPTDPGFPSFGNYLNISDNTASFSASPQAVGFAHVLQSLPPGAVVVKAVIPVKLSSFSRYTQTNTVVNVRMVEPYFLGGRWWGGMTYDTETESSTDYSGEVSFTLFGRKKTGVYTNVSGRVRRRTAWDALASEIPSTVSNNQWAVIDLTNTCNTFLNTYKFGDYFSFVLFPSAEGTPIGNSDIKGWLAGLPYKPPFVIAQNPLWDTGQGEPTAKNHGHNWGGADMPNDRYQTTLQDIMYNPVSKQYNMTFGSLEFGEGVIEWTLPISQNKHTVTYRNIIRGDSPIIV